MSLRKKQTKEEDLVKIFKAMADPNRLAILYRLQSEGELNCSTLISNSEVSAPTISHHLKILYECNLVVRRRDGQVFYNSLNRELFEEIKKELNVFT